MKEENKNGNTNSKNSRLVNFYWYVIVFFCTNSFRKQLVDELANESIPNTK